MLATSNSLVFICFDLDKVQIFFTSRQVLQAARS